HGGLRHGREEAGSALARNVDLAAHAAVVDVAAANRRDDQVAVDAVDVEVAGTDRADVDAATDVRQFRVAGADGADLHAAVRAAQPEIARADAADVGVAAHVRRLDVAGSDRQHVQAAGIVHPDVAGADLGGHPPAGAAQVDVARSHVGAERRGAGGPGVARTHVQLHQHVVGHVRVEFEVGVAVALAEGKSAPAVVALQPDDQLVAATLLGEGQALQVAGVRRAGAARDLAAGRRDGFDAQLVGADLEQYRLHAREVEVEIARRAVGAFVRQRG